MKILFYLLPVFAGVAITIQSGVNSQLRTSIQHPLMAAFISFVVGTIALAILLIFSKETIPGLSQFSSVNWYKYTGGLLGAFVVTVTLKSVAQIGAGNMFVLIVACKDINKDEELLVSYGLDYWKYMTIFAA